MDELRSARTDLSDGWAWDKPGRFDDPDLFLNRELSWIDFNFRVLQEAQDPENPLLERMKFLGIVAANLDEFFMVRVAGVKRQIASGTVRTAADGLLPEELFAEIAKRCHLQVRDLYECLLREVMPALREEGVQLHAVADLDRAKAQWVDDYFHRRVFPILTPLAVDPGHPFPLLRSTSLNMAVRLRNPKLRHRPEYFAVVQVPQGIPRFIRLPEEEGYHFVLLEDVIATHIEELFPGFEAIDVQPFFLLRDHDIEVDEEEGEDLLEIIEGELRKRDFSAVVRLDVLTPCPREIVDRLRVAFQLQEEDIYRVPAMLRLRDLLHLYRQVDRPDLCYPAFVPVTISRLKASSDIFKAIREGDILLHHPYESFDAVIQFLEQAATDPQVLAIKQTLYRTDGDSAIVRALERAAESGKQVTVLVELKARFDELQNIHWAKRLEEAGVHVVYGLVGLKTHCKVLLVVRDEGEERLRRYVHLSTGNYNSTTARLYTDLGFFTCDLAFGRDASRLFNILTGYSEFPQWRRFSVAPLGLRERLTELIMREKEHAENGGVGRIIAKMNALVDRQIIQSLYEASCAGVQIDLIVRGICCLKPGIPGVSENIRVRSLVGRFLEHSRIFYFANNGNEEVYLSSADWMPRNLIRRVEVMWPIEDPTLRRRLIDQILAVSLQDNVRARVMQPDGSWVWEKAPPGERIDSQELFMQIAEEEHSSHPLRPFSADFFLRHTSDYEWITPPPNHRKRKE
ncbi:MAG: polyphosphate kinase [Candidatus Poribacteria bacterium]|nr:MAG: polyphosphate kinase [Candidatus Poribacteria bacterium]